MKSDSTILIDDRVDETKSDRVVPLLYGAIGSAAAGMYALDATLDEASPRPLQFDVGAIHSHLAAVEPKSLHQAALELALAIVAPDDQFGKLIRRIVRRPPAAAFGDVEKLLNAYGWSIDRQRGSHVTFGKEGERSITLPVHNGNVGRRYLDMICERLGLDD